MDFGQGQGREDETEEGDIDLHLLILLGLEQDVIVGGDLAHILVITGGQGRLSGVTGILDPILGGDMLSHLEDVKFIKIGLQSPLL